MRFRIQLQNDSGPEAALKTDWIIANQIVVRNYELLLNLAPLTPYLDDYMHLGSVSASLEGEIKG